VHPCFSLPRREIAGKNRVEGYIFEENLFRINYLYISADAPKAA
jgi:hypothetical protein